MSWFPSHKPQFTHCGLGRIMHPYRVVATSCEELTHWKRLWCWEGLGAGGEGDDRGWDGWMASPTRWKWVWVNSGSWWWTGRPGVLWFTESQRVGHDWATELNWMGLWGLHEVIYIKASKAGPCYFYSRNSVHFKKRWTWVYILIIFIWN